jgi:hypothetical protein
MYKYVGCKLERNYEDGGIKFTQPVLHQSFTNEFDLPDEKDPQTPAEDGHMIYSCKPEDAMSDKLQGQ